MPKELSDRIAVLCMQIDGARDTRDGYCGAPENGENRIDLWRAWMKDLRAVESLAEELHAILVDNRGRRVCELCGEEHGERFDCQSEQKPSPQNIKLSDACQVVETHARALGGNCTVIFCDNCVSVAPLGWPGDSTGKTFYAAMMDAQQTENDSCSTDRTK